MTRLATPETMRVLARIFRCDAHDDVGYWRTSDFKAPATAHKCGTRALQGRIEHRESLSPPTRFLLMRLWLPFSTQEVYPR